MKHENGQNEFWYRVAESLKILGSDVSTQPLQEEVMALPADEQILFFHSDPFDVARDISGQSEVSKNQLNAYLALVESREKLLLKKSAENRAAVNATQKALQQGTLLIKEIDTQGVWREISALKLEIHNSKKNSLQALENIKEEEIAKINVAIILSRIVNLASLAFMIVGLVLMTNGLGDKKFWIGSVGLFLVFLTTLFQGELTRVFIRYKSKHPASLKQTFRSNPKKSMSS